MERTIKIVLAVILILCLTPMPYGFYQFVRFASCVGFTILAFSANQKEQGTQAIIFIVLALLFQPFLKVTLGRTIWNIVDVIVAIGLLATLFSTSKRDTNDVAKK